MRTIGYAGVPNNRDPFAAVNHLAAFRHHRRYHPKMTVNPDKAIMLDQHFQAANAMVLDANDRSWRDRRNRSAKRRRKIDSNVKRSRQWPVR